ncbi:MAG: metallophosphoesterase [Candidatus Diapherotrites archaeon]
METKGKENQNPRNQISQGFEIIDLCLFLPAENVLALADLHLGYEEMLNREGSLVPRINFSGIKERLEKVFAVLRERHGISRLEKIIINGDLKHEFGTISEQEWGEVVDMLGFLQKKCKKIVLVRGNHDKVLGPIAKWRGIEIEECHFLPAGKVLFLHGHKLPTKHELNRAHVLVIAHEHPAITIREGAKAETYKCFLRGKHKGKTLIVMPSLNQIHIGTNIARERLLSPFLQGGIGEFEVWACEQGETYAFGKLNELQ